MKEEKDTKVRETFRKAKFRKMTPKEWKDYVAKRKESKRDPYKPKGIFNKNTAKLLAQVDN